MIPLGVPVNSLTYEYHLIIPHPRERRILLLRRDDLWILPSFAHRNREFWQQVEHINQAASARLGLSATTLRCMHIRHDPVAGRISAVYGLENHMPDWIPPAGALWVGEAEVRELTLARPEHRSILARWFRWIDGGYARVNIIPWYRPDWFTTAAAWITQVLTRLGMTPTGPIRQIRSWQRSCLLAVNTEQGQFYLKAVPRVFGHEPGLTHALASRYVDHFPQVVARHPHHPWYLMADLGDISLDQIEDVRVWENALRVYALIQMDLAERTDILGELGCPQRGLAELAQGIGDLLHDEAAMMIGSPAGLSRQDADRLPELAGILRQKCAQLASYRLPTTLEHGDFWPQQILLYQDRPVFIDWSDSSLSHPFFSLSAFEEILDMEGYLADVPNLASRLRTAYLGPWTVYEPMKRLQEALALAHPLAAAHNALFYRNTVLPNMPESWEMHYMTPFYLKRLLRLLDKKEN